VVIDGFMRHASAYDLEVISDVEGLTFNSPSAFSQLNFAPYQLVDDGTFRVSGPSNNEIVIEYSIRSYRIWAVVLLFMIISFAMGYPLLIFLGLCGAIVLYLYLSHYFIFRRLAPR
jgi:hypothetical protein